ncbi:hypothetical protein ABH923_001984 [Leifsonia sp. EB41]|uniref:hypothetical protein n=1 Tax=Leifsonia sp. EB41 TaxID=3156260 RepID=UPI0035160BE7
MNVQLPSPRPFGVSSEEAIELCREWMIYLGAADAVVASGMTRESCDIYSSGFLAWVDNSRGNLDIDVVEKAAGLAAADGRQPLIFLRGGVRPVARERADALGVALLNYRERDSSLDGRSRRGREVVATGLGGQ